MPLPFSSSPAKAGRGKWLSSRSVKRTAFIFIFFFSLYFFFFHSNGLGPSTQSTSLFQQYRSVSKADVSNGRNPNRTPKPRAAFVVLVRERNLNELLPSIRDIQWAFNDDPEHSYQYVFLSEKPFTPWFKDHINDFLSKRPSIPKVTFAIVPKEDWDVPAHIDMNKAHERWAILKQSKRVPYAASQTYRQMCRYMSGPIFRHPVLKDVDYYWRLEPETRHLCTYNSHWKKVNGKDEWVERDPFRYMKENGKKYSWIITMLEYRATVMTLMAHVNYWRKDNPAYIASNNTLSFVSNDGVGFNMCHYWTNFEIIDLSFTRSPAYTSYFQALDISGGFFYERWGDAPVRSIAASMMLNQSEIWNVDYAGYHHRPYGYCPRKLDPGQSCACDSHDNIDYDISHVSCQSKWDKANGIDSVARIKAINDANGIIENFKPGEEPYAIPPPRMVMHGDY